MLRCCRGGGDRDRWPGGGDRRRRSGWRSVSRRGDSSAAADDRRKEYRRASGRTLSSAELAVADSGRLHDDTATAAAAATVDATGPDVAAGLADCCWRTLTGRLTGGGGGCATQWNRGGGCSGGPGDGSVTVPAHGRGGHQQRPTGTATVLSNWTMISNSSLKDVDSDELRAELVGYDDDPTTTTTATAEYEDAVKPVGTVNQYY